MNRRIYISIVLALFSVVGLILFQALWLSRTYFETEKNFTISVSSILVKTMGDDAIMRYGKNERDTSIHYVSTNYEKLVTTIVYHNGEKREKHYDNREKQIDEYYGSNHELAGIHLQSLDSLYRSNLDSLYILLPFILEAIDIQSEEVISSTFLEGDTNEYTFPTITYPWGIFNEKAIRARFVSPYQMVIGKMKPLFISSIFLAALLLFTVAFLIRTLFYQKKIAEIRTDFVNVVVHELKNPLLYISKDVETRKTETDVPPGSYDGIEHSTKRMNQMINKLLSATIKRERLRLDYTETDLHELLLSVATQYQLKFPENYLSLIPNEKDTPLVVHADRLHVENALVNLIDNAIKYCRKTPQVTLSAYLKNHMAYISVKDNGIGISKREQRLIFDKYYRVRGKNDPIKRHGFGLGLSYVKMVAKSHNGKIIVNSKLNEGSEFILVIPF